MECYQRRRSSGAAKWNGASSHDSALGFLKKHDLFGRCWVYTHPAAEDAYLLVPTTNGIRHVKPGQWIVEDARVIGPQTYSIWNAEHFDSLFEECTVAFRRRRELAKQEQRK